MKKFSLIFILFILLSLVSCSCTPETPDSPDYVGDYAVKRYQYYTYLDTISSIIIEFDKNVISETEINTKMKEIDNILYNVELLFSPEPTITMEMKNATSLLMEVNNNSGKKVDGNLVKTPVTDAFLEVLKASIEVSETLDGYFDPSVGALTSLWDIPNQVGKINQHKPTDEEISKVLNGVGYQKIIVDYDNKMVSLPEGTLLDFGAIAKGYACDQVLAYLKTLDITLCLIDLGGNIYSYGESKSIKTNTGIRNPFSSSDNDYTLLTSDINNVSVVTSGIYERYITVDGVMYHHLLDPKTGYPFDNEIESVSIIGTSSMKCDAIATGIYGLGLANGIQVMKNMPGYEAIFITKSQKVYIVGELKFEVNPYIDENFEFIRVTKNVR